MLCVSIYNIRIEYKDRRQLKTFLTQIRSVLLLTPDSPIICFWRWIGWKDYGVKKSQFGECFRQKRIVFLTTPAHTRALYPPDPPSATAQRTRPLARDRKKILRTRRSHPKAGTPKAAQPNRSGTVEVATLPRGGCDAPGFYLAIIVGQLCWRWLKHGQPGSSPWKPYHPTLVTLLIKSIHMCGQTLVNCTVKPYLNPSDLECLPELLPRSPNFT
jgi:hypothetical protein